MVVPIFPWIGGKRSIRNEIVKHFPLKKDYDIYIEPFLGAGSLLLTLCPSNAVVNDLNPWVVMLWHLCSHHPEYVIKQLQTLADGKQDEETVFKKMHTVFNDNHTMTQKEVPTSFVSNSKSCQCSAHLLKMSFYYFVLVKCSYGAKVVFNKDNQVKCNYGSKPFAWIVNENYLDVHLYLSRNHITFLVGDYTNAIRSIKGKACIYFDPPYQATDLKNNVGKYHATKHFIDDDQVKLKDIIDKLASRHFIVQSNSCTKYIRDLYKEYNIVPLHVRRPLSSMLKERENTKPKANECIITNF